MIDIGLYIFYVLFFVALAATIILPALNIMKNPTSLKSSGLGVGALVLLFVVSYALSGSEVTTKYLSAGVNEGSSKLIGAGLIMFYIVLVVSVIGMVYSEINKALK